MRYDAQRHDLTRARKVNPETRKPSRKKGAPCPECGSITTATKNRHRTPSGRVCGVTIPTELPPVVISEVRQGNRRQSPTGECYGCGIGVTGDRLYCGPCMAARL